MYFPNLYPHAAVLPDFTSAILPHQGVLWNTQYTKLTPDAEHNADQLDCHTLLCPHNVFDGSTNGMQLASKISILQGNCSSWKFKLWRPKWRKIRNNTDNLWTWILNLYSITTLDCRIIFNELDREKIISLTFHINVLLLNQTVYCTCNPVQC